MLNKLSCIQLKGKEKIFLILKGFILGTAIVVPGISAGTMAVVTGLYSALIRFLSMFSTWMIKNKYLEIKTTFFYLTPVFIGMALGFFLSVWWIRYIINAFPILSYSFFSGVILASIPFLFHQIRIRWVSGLVFIACTLLSFSISFLDSLFISGWFWFFLSIYLSTVAMLLPGVSGSYTLVIMGTYSQFLDIFNTFSLKTIWVVLIGLFSLFSSSSIIQYTLKKYRSGTMVCLIGLTFGGGLGVFPLRSKLEWVEHGVSGTSFLLFGMLFVFFIHYVCRIFRR